MGDALSLSTVKAFAAQHGLKFAGALFINAENGRFAFAPAAALTAEEVAMVVRILELNSETLPEIGIHTQ